MPEAAGGKALGIFGGTFDPVHYGHLRLAEEAADRLDLAAVRWIPAGRPALRSAPQAPAGQRLAMVRLAVAGNPRFVVDAAEVEAAQPSYTVPTLERLRASDDCGGERALVLLIGADAFAGLASWHRWPEIFALAHLGIAQRPGFALDFERLPEALAAACRERFCADPAELATTPAGRIASFAMTPLAISATQIRALLQQRASVRYLLPDPVIAHLHHHHLYPEY